MSEQVGKHGTGKYLTRESHRYRHEREARDFLSQPNLFFVNNMPVLLNRLFRCWLERHSDGFAELLERFIEFALNVFGSAECRMENLLVVSLFDIGENPCSRHGKIRTAPLVDAKKRHNHRDENSACDTGGEE